MTKQIELLASAIHDAKNQIFYASGFAAAAAVEYGIDLGPMKKAMDRAASRLGRALIAYRIGSEELPLSLSAVSIHGLIEDALASSNHLYNPSWLSLKSRCDIEGIWQMDRDLVLDAINNALENAARFARSRVFLSAQQEGDNLLIRVEDDGPGYDDANTETVSGNSLGLHIGRRIAALHQRQGHHGELRTYNRGPRGGAVFELRLP